ncbi:hypothetical protein CRI94_01275 [Longibacter salinarum]|uniref:Uncharacterized protein n=2 Tax=Longibacter salinarum TaxID=1850348 RepID=A0A2A8D1V7_9BACT|nr:hypothetical protein CRI94_01275 [Longibacter salinarum]
MHNVKNLDASPTPDGIDQLRTEAQEHAEAVAAALPWGSDTYLVVSPRGTCVLLDDFVTRDSWEPNKSSETVATELQAT